MIVLQNIHKKRNNKNVINLQPSIVLLKIVIFKSIIIVFKLILIDVFRIKETKNE